MTHAIAPVGTSIQFFPPAASHYARIVDWIFFAWLFVSVVFVSLIGVSIVYFCVKYRRKKRPNPPQRMPSSPLIETIWIVVPFLINIVMFAWGADVYLARMSNGPKNAYDVFVLGKQWMWQFEHPNGRREIDTLHVPLGKPVRLIMMSQDVIHDVFIPAFRIKHDVLPMKYTSYWFVATKPGRYDLLCAQYCGTQHSQMTGEVVVMRPEEFQKWLDSSVGMNSPAAEGAAALQVLGCRSCHRLDSLSRAPKLEGLFGGPVELSDGSVVTADENYLRDSILDPPKQIVAHYQPVMPSYRGKVSEEEIMQIIAYLKSMPNERTRQNP